MTAIAQTTPREWADAALADLDAGDPGAALLMLEIAARRDGRYQPALTEMRQGRLDGARRLLERVVGEGSA